MKLMIEGKSKKTVERKRWNNHDYWMGYWSGEMKGNTGILIANLDLSHDLRLS